MLGRFKNAGSKFWQAYSEFIQPAAATAAVYEFLKKYPETDNTNNEHETELSGQTSSPDMNNGSGFDHC